MPTPAPASPNSPDPAGTMLHGIWSGLVGAAHQHPWLVAVVALMLLAGVVRSARVAIHTGPRDSVRCFTRVDKNTLLARAGHRCEHMG